MTAQDIAHTPAPASPMRLLGTIGLSLAIAYLIVLGAAWFGGYWLHDALGRPIANDFVNVWAAGRLAADGHPEMAYDWTIHKSMEVRAVGHAFENYYGWHYPPTFLFVAVPLALLPFTVSALAWLGATFAAYAATIRAIIGDRAGWFLALGFPAALWNVTAGQNGFLTAALIGGTLLLLERRPVLAGICLGLLSYKPHFGLLFPVALIAAQQWRALLWAATTGIVMIALSLFAFGVESWSAFFASMPKLTEAVLGQGLAEFGRLQSLFGLVRWLGWNEKLAWATQLIAALACIATVFAAWRSLMAYELKAALLVALALVATPYLYIYDLVVLAVACAFLLRYALPRGLVVAEAAGLSAVCLLLLIYPYVKTQVGLAAAIIVAALALNRHLIQRAKIAA